MNRKDIVKKALKNTVKEILVGIMMCVSLFGFIVGVIYVFYRLPYWVFGLIGKLEILAEYPAGYIYTLEFFILFFVILIGACIYIKFSDNLYDLEKEEEKKEGEVI